MSLFRRLDLVFLDGRSSSSSGVMMSVVMMTTVFAALDIRLDVEIEKEACDDDAVDEIGGRERFRERASGRHYVYYRVEHDSEKLDLKCRIIRYDI